ncbi:heme ABC transporter ATP-binding protein [Arthrobacter sp. MYb229]|uniref:ABC transporter ATP-binding protein n=1 Tax=unclassified Arthrobacter TaxID=235627 RepID=UPI000CFB80DE|nr:MULTISPECIES: ABC transporter ATP-binding protein [unclassified Arthrobacter]PQZ98585.1 heme ABC transporter ATP-binding protein [Arthrobacter sp. MYb229]PRB47173.1 heme ABC transporter ATP-binding protein [Arthrobacter sp. MYb216]
MKLELRGISKAFGSFYANKDIDLVVDDAQIHCLLGENGAGKSTLMNVLYGLYQPTEGHILLDDKPVAFSGPGDAMAAGIGMVHQHFMLIPVFTVAENIALGAEATKAGGVLDLQVTRKKVREISDRYGFNVDPDAVVEDLPVGVQQRVEIIKALVREAKVLILDEPTAVLTPQETDELLDIMRQLKANGTSIVFISHKLREVRAVSDVITVVRRGLVVDSVAPETSTTELANLMVGRAVQLNLDKEAGTPGEASLAVRELSVINPAGTTTLDRVSFDIHKGEILAVAGVQGNGQTELTEAILGTQPVNAGSIKLDGQELVGKSVKAVLRSGVGFVPEDRSVHGLVTQFSIEENLILDLYDRKPFGKGISMNLEAMKKNATKQIADFDVRTDNPLNPASSLSGGNQQKVVMARELSRDLKLFIASQPTRGVDVGSIEFLHRRIVAERDKGTPVLIVSTELDEVMELADRIAVLYKGKINGIVPGDTSREVLGLMMAGVSQEDATSQAGHVKADAEPVEATPVPVETKQPGQAAPGESNAAEGEAQ